MNPEYKIIFLMPYRGELNKSVVKDLQGRVMEKLKDTFKYGNFKYHFTAVDYTKASKTLPHADKNEVPTLYVTLQSGTLIPSLYSRHFRGSFFRPIGKCLGIRKGMVKKVNTDSPDFLEAVIVSIHSWLLDMKIPLNSINTVFLKPNNIRKAETRPFVPPSPPAETSRAYNEGLKAILKRYADLYPNKNAELLKELQGAYVDVVKKHIRGAISEKALAASTSELKQLTDLLFDLEG